IRLKIQGKVFLGNQMAKQTKEWEHQDDSEIVKAGDDTPNHQHRLGRGAEKKGNPKIEFDIEELGLKRSISRASDPETLPVVKILTRFNNDLVLKRKAILSLDCLVRLRKFQLIKAIEKGPNKEILPVINPVSEGRITNK